MQRFKEKRGENANMKPEPLYEVIKRWWNEARVLLNPKTEEEFRDEVSNLILLVKRNEKQRVKQLLEEIEKMEKELRPTIPTTYEDGFYNCLCVVKEKIKKAFEGSVE